MNKFIFYLKFTVPQPSKLTKAKIVMVGVMQIKSLVKFFMKLILGLNLNRSFLLELGNI
jgi:hypothetical protein